MPGSMKGKFHSVEQVNNLREVQALRRLIPHPNIVCLLEVIFERAVGRLDLVCELMDMNLYERMRGAPAIAPSRPLASHQPRSLPPRRALMPGPLVQGGGPTSPRRS